MRLHGAGAAGLVAACVVAPLGCATNTNVLSPRVAAVIDDAQLGIPVRKVRASVYWIQSFGRGMGVDVWSPRAAGDYARDLALELDGAARVCAALVESDAFPERDFLEVRFYCEYGRLPPRGRHVVGVVVVVIDRKTCRRLRDGNVPASEYPRHWAYFHGYKDQPDSKRLLEWEVVPGSPAASAAPAPAQAGGKGAGPARG